jgi:hypothetical protein
MKLLLHSWYLLVMLIASRVSFAQAPVWSSYPSASAVIFLDFDGHTVDGTSWNWSGLPIVCSSSGLNTTIMQEIFNRVAEDFRPFNINITTDSTRFMAAPVNQRMRVIITTSSSWYGSAGGVAFIGSFIWGDDHPCFVFSALLNNNPKKISEAVSHEAGHTLGLYHQSQYDTYCNKLTDYYSGQGTGEIGWAPIMGVGYNRNFTLWSNGPNSLGCASYQSDLDVIVSADNGFGYRTDDHSNESANATQLLFSNSQFEMNGIIHQNTDQDIFRFSMPDRAKFTLNATPYNVGANNAGSNLDMQITLYDASNNLLNIYNPGSLLNSVADTTLNPGMYYLKVEGKGNTYAPAYASLGSYSLHGVIEGGVALPVFAVSLKSEYKNNGLQFSWTIEADEPVTQQTLEILNGAMFNATTDVPVNEKSYFDEALNAGQYRLKVVFADGHIHYSNIVSIAHTEVVHKPKFLSNPINSGTLYVNSPGNYDYSLIDLTGKMIRNGKIVSGVNNIDMTNVMPGVYIMRYMDNNRQWTDKLLRQ